MTIVATVALAGFVLMGGSPSAQVKTIPADKVTATGTIEAIEKTTRTVTVKNEDGTYDTLHAPDDMKRFSELKVGDKITATYYSSLIVRLKKPGEAAVNTEEAKVTPGSGARPAGTAAVQRTITATITAIDMSVPSITVQGPNGWTYSRKVQDKKALAQVKVGDRLDITWNDAVLISVK